MHTLRLALLATLCSLLIACSGIRTETLRERPLLLSGMASYQWAVLPGEDDAHASSQQALHQTLRREIDRLMADKGYQRLTEGADMELDYRVVISQAERARYADSAISADDYGIEWRFDRDTLPQRKPTLKHEQVLDAEFYRIGRLLLAAIDTRSGKTVWMRSAEKDLNAEDSVEKQQTLVQKIAQKLLKPFPER